MSLCFVQSRCLLSSPSVLPASCPQTLFRQPWLHTAFVCLKFDMKNTFNLHVVSWQPLLDHFLYPFLDMFGWPTPLPVRVLSCGTLRGLSCGAHVCCRRAEGRSHDSKDVEVCEDGRELSSILGKSAENCKWTPCKWRVHHCPENVELQDAMILLVTKSYSLIKWKIIIVHFSSKALTKLLMDWNEIRPARIPNE